MAIDFSTPAAADQIISMCVERSVPLVMATTGLSDAQHQSLRDAADKIAVLWAPSMSLAVNLAMKLTEIAQFVRIFTPNKVLSKNIQKLKSCMIFPKIFFQKRAKTNYLQRGS